jgi:multiple sugar transport system permease protein
VSDGQAIPAASVQQPPAAASRARPFVRRRTLVTAARLLLACGLVVLFLFPIYWLVIMAFKTADEIFAFPPVWWPGSFNLANFAVLFRDGDWISVRNSLVLASVSTVVSMVLGTLAAYAIERFRTGGENLAVWIISQRMLPPVTIVFPVFLLYVALGLVDSFAGLILLYVAFSLPYVIWMMRGYIQDIPLELEESAEVDGCSRWQILWRVVFPMARTGLFATAVFTFVFVWNDFLFALVLTRTEVVTYTVQVTHYFGGQSNFWAKIAAMSVLGTVPVFLTVASLQRYFVRGISMGAVKG